jgi:hypothetical protein
VQQPQKKTRRIVGIRHRLSSAGHERQDHNPEQREQAD